METADFIGIIKLPTKNGLLNKILHKGLYCQYNTCFFLNILLSNSFSFYAIQLIDGIYKFQNRVFHTKKHDIPVVT